jgi:hypothetical protein
MECTAIEVRARMSHHAACSEHAAIMSKKRDKFGGVMM